MSDFEAKPATEASNFVPLARLRGRPEPVGSGEAQAVAAFERNLESFAAGLSEAEREALRGLVGSGNPAYAVLGSEPPERILSADEAALVAELEAAPVPAHRTLPGFVVLIMKATLRCNLRCTYCSSWSDDPDQVMPFEVLARATHGALRAPGVGAVQFVWHGGESTLRPLSFYRKALWLQERFRRPGQKVSNSLQTNGTYLTDEWLAFLTRYGLDVGISLDGPPELHDRRRLDVKGLPTSARVRAGLEKLQAHGIAHGVLMVVDQDVVELGARRILECLLELGVGHAALLNVAPEGDPVLADPDEPYLDYRRFVGFLRELFALWYPDHVERITFREISNLVRQIEGQPNGFCVYGKNCVGGFFTVEPQGDVSHCDKYQQNPDFVFGNLRDVPLYEIPTRPPLLHAHGYTAAGLDLCRGCRWYGVCGGGCPFDRYTRVVRRKAAHDERCCGLAPLLDDMERALRPGSRT